MKTKKGEQEGTTTYEIEEEKRRYVVGAKYRDPEAPGAKPIMDILLRLMINDVTKKEG